MRPRHTSLTAHRGRRRLPARMRFLGLIAGLATWSSIGIAEAASRFDPAFRFQSLRTEHFVVYFHEGQEHLARRLAAIAEEAWQALGSVLAPRALTHVVLADQSDSANGWATPLPYNTVVLSAAWPSGAELIGNTDEWLRTVFVHELTHIGHLDRARGWSAAVRRLFGRVPLAFPNLFLPTWQIEGIATYQESVVGGRGRLHAGDFRVIEQEAARAGAVPPLDRVNGGLTDWPGGQSPYAYGLGFHQYLADRFGARALEKLADATAGRLPYLGSSAWRPTVGESLGSLWEDYTRSLAASVGGAVDLTSVRRLTHHGFTVTGPRFAPPPCAGCPADIVYSTQNPHGFPALRAVRPDGTSPRRLGERYRGAVASATAELILFDQHELRRNVGLYGDLFLLDRRSDDVASLTSGARLSDPEWSPDGRYIACVREGNGRRDLVVIGPVDAAGPDESFDSRAARIRQAAVAARTLVSEADTQFNTPRWSRDGRLLAVERHQIGSGSQVVTVDPVTAEIRPVASVPGGRIVTPAWTPRDTIVAAVQVDSNPFELYEFSLDGAWPQRRLTRTNGGATWPDVSSDGSTIVFVGYTPQGFDLFTMPFSAAAGVEEDDESSVAPAPLPRLPSLASTEAVSAAASAYTPVPTLKPVSWTPVIETGDDELRLGIASGGTDVLGYHVYEASATWLATRPDSVSRASARAPDWKIAYVYDRWRPSWFAAAQSTTSFFAGPVTEGGTPSSGSLRARELEAGVVLPFRRVRTVHQLRASASWLDEEYREGDLRIAARQSTLRAAWAANSSRQYGYSISREHGLLAGTTVELAGRGFGPGADATTVTADVRAYLPGLANHHVVALRAAGGRSAGRAGVARPFLLGGASASGSVADFGRGALGLLRGFEGHAFAGARLANVNGEYRRPIARPQRGVGTWPLFLHTIHAALFADAGHAWTSRFDVASVKASVGAEISANLIAGYSWPLTLTLGVAWGRDGAAPSARGATTYVRIGPAF